jgi:hypothetical protein
MRRRRGSIALTSSAPEANRPHPRRAVARDRSRKAVLIGVILPFQVQGHIDYHALAVTCETAKEAFAKAVEWQVVQFADVSISDGIKRYTVTEFASLMALKEVADTVEASAALRRNAKT